MTNVEVQTPEMKRVERILDDPEYAESVLRKAFEEENATNFKIKVISTLIYKYGFTEDEGLELWKLAVKHCEYKLMCKFLAYYPASPYYFLFTPGVKLIPLQSV